MYVTLHERKISAEDVIDYAKENGIVLQRGTASRCGIGVVCAMFGCTNYDIEDGNRMFGLDVASSIEVGFEQNVYFWNNGMRLMPSYFRFGKEIYEEAERRGCLEE